MKRMILGIALFTVLAFVNSLTGAAPEQELGKWWKKSDIVNALQLSYSQVNKIEQTFLNYRAALSNYSEELRKRESDLRIMMQADPVDDSKVLAQTELVAQSRAALEKANAAMMLAIRRDLTKEQWNKLEVIKATRSASGGSTQIPPELFGNIDRTPSGEKIYRVGDPIVPPRVVYQPLPHYTDEAKAARIEGIILIRGIIRKTGRVDNMVVLRGLGYGLDERALETLAKEWRFEPGTFNGEPVDVQVNIEMSFRLY